MSDTVEKRKLSELRVVDLKQELEKRDKDGNGVKNVLIDRLTQVGGRHFARNNSPYWI